MAETKNAEEATLPAKRKADLSSQDLDSSSPKASKIVPEEKVEPQEGNHTTHNKNLGASGNNDASVPESRSRGKELAIDAEEDDDGDYEDEDDAKSEDGVNGVAPVDRKGKGILIEEDDDSEEDDDDDDDSSDAGDESDGESDLSDDPLAEVDLDNILPSRTRRRAGRSGVHIANDLGNNGGSDDSDA